MYCVTYKSTSVLHERNVERVKIRKHKKDCIDSENTYHYPSYDLGGLSVAVKFFMMLFYR